MEKFSIHLNEDSIATGTLSIGWRCPKNVFDALEAVGITDPQALIVISPTKKYSPFKEQREMIPLRDLIGYVELHSKGEHYIRAFICEKENRYIGKSAGTYSETVLNNSGDDWYNYIKTMKRMELYSEPLIIDIPSECFAKEPPEWEKIWVNWLVSDKAIDQCQFRKRRMFAYTVQPFIFLLSFALNILMTFAAFMVGSKGANFNSILFPLEYTVPSNFEDLFRNGCRYYSIDDEKPWLSRVKWLPLMPAFVVAEIAIILEASGKIDNHPSIDAFLKMYLTFASVGLISLLLISVFISIHIYKEHQKTVKPVWYKNDVERELLSGENSKLTRLADLPSQKKILKLRFLDFKQRICRPFSR